MLISPSIIIIHVHQGFISCKTVTMTNRDDTICWIPLSTSVSVVGWLPVTTNAFVWPALAYFD